MAVLPIVTLPDARLRAASKPVEVVDDAVRRLLDDMLDTMYEAPGIGLAAVQVGDLRRLVVVDTARDDEPKAPLFLVNPDVVWRSEDTSTYEEGCLSIPDEYYEVTRPAAVRVRFRDRDGTSREMEASGLLATVLQHEIDHLDGVLFLDHLSRLKRERVTKKFEKAARHAREEGRPFTPREGERPAPPERRSPRPTASTSWRT